MATRIPILRILGGIVFVLAGLAYYLGVTVSASLALVFVVGGAAVILLGVFGHRANGLDVAIFVISLLVLGAFITPGIGAPEAAGRTVVTHTVARSSLTSHNIDLIATTDVGSVSVSYSDASTLGYQVNFTRSVFPFSIFTGKPPSTSLSNETTGGAFVLNATAHSYDISVLLGRGYALNVTASTGTGNVDVKTSADMTLGNVTLQSGTGNVDANLTSTAAGTISMQTGTGSVTLSSAHLGPDGARVPISLQAGTGEVTFDVILAAGTAVSLEANSGLGSIGHNLQGFVVSQQSTRSDLIATAGDPSTAPASFVVHITTGTGSVTADARFSS